jgi:hypothetical protein
VTGANRARHSPIPNAAILFFTGFLSFVLDISCSNPDLLLTHLTDPASL